MVKNQMINDKTFSEIYDDFLKPVAKESGETLSLIPRSINAALAPLRQWIAQKEYNVSETQKLLSQKLKNVSPEKIVTPEAYVAVPALQALSYSMDNNELRNLFANLLAKSMNTETKSSVHPSFVEIIKQLSPTDAIIFVEISTVNFFPLVSLSVEKYSADQLESNKIGQIKAPKERHSIPNISYFQDIDYEVVLLSIDNLLRLRLIEEMFPLSNITPSSVQKNPIYINSKLELDEYMTDSNWRYYETCRSLSLTSLGRIFYQICVKDI